MASGRKAKAIILFQEILLKNIKFGKPQSLSFYD